MAMETFISQLFATVRRFDVPLSYPLPNESMHTSLSRWNFTVNPGDICKVTPCGHEKEIFSISAINVKSWLYFIKHCFRSILHCAL